MITPIHTGPISDLVKDVNEELAQRPKETQTVPFAVLALNRRLPRKYLESRGLYAAFINEEQFYGGTEMPITLKVGYRPGPGQAVARQPFSALNPELYLQRNPETRAVSVFVQHMDDEAAHDRPLTELIDVARSEIDDFLSGIRNREYETQIVTGSGFPLRQNVLDVINWNTPAPESPLDILERKLSGIITLDDFLEVSIHAYLMASGNRAVTPRTFSAGLFWTNPTDSTHHFTELLNRKALLEILCPCVYSRDPAASHWQSDGVNWMDMFTKEAETCKKDGGDGISVCIMYEGIAEAWDKTVPRRLWVERRYILSA